MMTDISSLGLCVPAVVGIATLAGYYAGNLSRLVRLPSIIGYMFVGVLLGPSVLNLMTDSSVENMSFISEIALGLVAFSIGAELDLSSLRSLGKGIISIILAESFGAFFLVLAALYLLTRDLPMSLIFASMAPASAPAGTVAVIQECRSRGSLTKALYAVVGFDDGLAIIIFGFAAAMAKNLLMAEATGRSDSILPAMLPPAREIALSIIVGCVIGFVFCRLIRGLRAGSEIFVVVFGTVLIATGLSAQWHLSLIMTNMVVGFVLVNTRQETTVRRVMAPLLDIMPLVFVLFFCLAGAHLKLSALPSLGAVGIIYILGRSVGLMGGAYLGGAVGSVEEKVRKYVGLGILSQAGVAIGLSLIVSSEFGRLAAEYSLPHAAKIGTSVITTITATCIFFEIVGPILTKVALKKAGEIGLADRG